MIIDAHMHMDTALTPKILRQQGITCIANAATPKEYEELKKLQSDNPAIWISAGIHGRWSRLAGKRCCRF